MTDTMNELQLTTERTINAPQEKLFKAWLDPDMLKRFMLPAENASVPTAKTDPHVGGRFEILMMAGDNEIPHAGTYRAIDPHERIVFTWESPFSVDGSEVTVLFAPDGGGTKVTLTHVRFPNEESRGNHEAGWKRILDTLDSVAA